MCSDVESLGLGVECYLSKSCAKLLTGWKGERAPDFFENEERRLWAVVVMKVDKSLRLPRLLQRGGLSGCRQGSGIDARRITLGERASDVLKDMQPVKGDVTDAIHEKGAGRLCWK